MLITWWKEETTKLQILFLSFSPDKSRRDWHKISRDYNDFLDTILPAPEQNSPVAVPDQMNRLADVLTNLQIRPAAQQPFTIRPVNIFTMAFSGSI